jgi:hypothetical protein
MSAARSLTGEWDGIFNYPHSLPPTAFAATLREEGGMLSGETVETGDGGARHALLQGTCNGAAVAFVKTYDNGHRMPIHYAGTLDAEASEITGRWHIVGHWSGTFIMVRTAADEDHIEERVGETMRADAS